MVEVIASGGAVATPHAAAAAAGRAVLQAGGNAIDAAVAAMMAVTVVQSYQVGLGGYGGSLVVYEAEKQRVSAIDFDARAPLAFKPELFPSAKQSEHGYLSLGVPGVVAGLDLALRQFGTRPWRGVSEHALKLAEEGFPVDAPLKNALGVLAKNADPTSVQAMLPDGRVPAVGERWVQKDLGRLIRQLDDDPSAFYHGDIPRAIVRQVRENGGILAEEDFARFAAQVVEPVHIRYRGHDLYTPPLPSGGLTTLSILKTLEQFDLSHYEPWSAPFFDLYVEAAKIGWEERRQYFGDPDFVKVPVDELLSEERAAQRADRLRHGVRPATQPLPTGGPHTANIIAIDRWRNLVSLTATQGDTWGSRVAIKGLGLVLGHGMSRFTYAWQDPNSPNAPAPGKRVQHNMCPTLILRDGKPRATLGLPGGTRIVTVTGLMTVGLLDFHLSPGQLVTSPRVHTDGGEPLLASPAVPEATARELELMGHRVRRKQPVGGPANVGVLDASATQITIASGAGPAGVAGV
jgi:gamma-glutamyltranspeptidase / glutathione hydrolase